MLQLSRAKLEWHIGLLGRHSQRIWHLQSRRLLAGVQESHNRIIWEQKLLQCPVNNKTFVALYTDRGCEVCGKSRIRKVSVEFHWRLCESCTHASTISDYRLRTDFQCPSEVVQSLSHTQATLWNRYIGEYELNFYAKRDVEIRLAQHGLPTLKQQEEQHKNRIRIASEATAAQLARSRERQQRRQELQSIRDERLVQIKTLLLKDAAWLDAGIVDFIDTTWSCAETCHLSKSLVNFLRQPRSITARDQTRLQKDDVRSQFLLAYQAAETELKNAAEMKVAQQRIAQEKELERRALLEQNQIDRQARLKQEKIERQARLKHEEIERTVISDRNRQLAMGCVNMACAAPVALPPATCDSTSFFNLLFGHCRVGGTQIDQQHVKTAQLNKNALFVHIEEGCTWRSMHAESQPKPVIRCAICNDTRDFQLVGLISHSRAKHGDDTSFFVCFSDDLCLDTHP